MFSRTTTTHFAILRKRFVDDAREFRTLCGISTHALALSEFVTAVQFETVVSCVACQADLIDLRLTPPENRDALP